MGQSQEAQSVYGRTPPIKYNHVVDVNKHHSLFTCNIIFFLLGEEPVCRLWIERMILQYVEWTNKYSLKFNVPIFDRWLLSDYYLPC